MGSALDFYGSSETAETKVFVETFDKFFDCLNVRNLDEHRKKLKPNLRPYRSPDDDCLKVIKYNVIVFIHVIVCDESCMLCQ